MLNFEFLSINNDYSKGGSEFKIDLTVLIKKFKWKKKKKIYNYN